MANIKIQNMQAHFIKLVAVFVLISTVLTACVGSKFSNKRKGETLSLKVMEDSSYLRLHTLKTQQIPTLAMRGASSRGFGIGELVSLAAMGVDKLIALDKSQFTASYGQSVNDLYFYDQISNTGHFDPTGIQFKGLEIQRNVKIRKKDTTALHASFLIDTTQKYEILNSSVFRLRVQDLHLSYSKAKASTTKWYVPWTWGNKNIDDKMNMDLEIRFYTSYVTASGNFYDNVLVGKFSLNLRNMPLNPESEGYKAYYDSLAGDALGGYSFLIPRSCGFAFDEEKELQQIYNQGSYRIEVSVKETGKEKFIKTKLAENSTEIIKEGSNQLIKLLKD